MSMHNAGFGVPSGTGKGDLLGILIPVKGSMHTHSFGAGSTHCRGQKPAKPSIIAVQQTLPFSCCCWRQSPSKSTGIESGCKVMKETIKWQLQNNFASHLVADQLEHSLVDQLKQLECL